MVCLFSDFASTLANLSRTSSHRSNTFIYVGILLEDVTCLKTTTEEWEEKEGRG